MSDAEPQIKYQVRFDWGVAGFQALAAEADVVVLADALPAVDATRGFPTALGAHTVIVADLATSTLVADWALARQAEKGDCFSVAVVAVGERRADGTIRFAMEDLLVAGAVIDALAERGIDHCSPEAAAAAASYVGLKRAVKHLVTASETGQALGDDGRAAAVVAALAPATDGAVAVVTDFTFAA
ncbi:2-phosphosulfolactate phosphatase [Cryobacterium adonitolivorans]|uniref:2-phosphosulfolactate phosphatase n=1 Tax=Cryobacterium adonitolivorans TaxID=1259189 RepID=UPI001F5436F7|nr:2-phosphosulfolactate phosphatase [Cryobacterium adonitolivorans]